MTPLDIALAHLEQFPTDHLFPLAELSKFPPLLKKNLSDNCSNDPARLIAWSKEPRLRNCNWGIALRKSGLIVADADVAKDKPGRATYDWLDVLHGWPKTSVVLTPSKGFHQYFRGQHVMKVNGFGPALNSPNYSIVPGMKVKGGGVYRYVNDRPRAEAPTWFYQVLAPKPHGFGNITDAVIELDQHRNISHAIEYLRRDALPALEGNGGEFRTMLTAMQLRDEGISEERAVELMIQFYNERCDPPWDYDDFAKKIANGYAYASLRPPGGGTGEYDFTDDDPDVNSIVPHGVDRSKNFVILDGKKFSVARVGRLKKATKKGPTNAA